MEDKAIAILDVLGFENFVQNSKIENVLYSYESLLACTHKAKEIIDNSNLKIFIYSDTIVIIDENLIEKSLYNLTYICSLLIGSFFQSLISAFPLLPPIRGSICIGEYIFKKELKWQVSPINEPIKVDNSNIFLGKAIIDGYKWERHQKWIGISYSKESKIKLENDYINVLNNLTEKNLLIKYSVPLEKEIVETYAVNCFLDIVPEKIIRKLQSIENNFTQDINKKYQNTRKFFEYLLENSLFIKN